MWWSARSVLSRWSILHLLRQYQSQRFPWKLEVWLASEQRRVVRQIHPCDNDSSQLGCRINLAIIFVSMAFVAHSPPNYASALSSLNVPQGPVVTEKFAHLPLFSQVTWRICLYGIMIYYIDVQVNGIMNMVRPHTIMPLSLVTKCPIGVCLWGCYDLSWNSDVFSFLCTFNIHLRQSDGRNATPDGLLERNGEPISASTLHRHVLIFDAFNRH